MSKDINVNIYVTRIDIVKKIIIVGIQLSHYKCPITIKQHSCLSCEKILQDSLTFPNNFLSHYCYLIIIAIIFTQLFYHSMMDSKVNGLKSSFPLSLHSDG